MSPSDEPAAPVPDPPSAPDRTQPTLQTARLTLVPLADDHLDLEMELDSDAEVMRYLTGHRLASPGALAPAPSGSVRIYSARPASTLGLRHAGSAVRRGRPESDFRFCG